MTSIDWLRFSKEKSQKKVNPLFIQYFISHHLGSGSGCPLRYMLKQGRFASARARAPNILLKEVWQGEKGALTGAMGSTRGQ